MTYTGCVNTLDLYWTLADAAGAADWKGEGVECESLYPIVEGDLNAPERPVFSILGPQAMLRRGALKLIRCKPESDRAVYELYDLEADPLETLNRFEDPDYGGHAQALKSELDAWVTAHPWN